MFNKKNVEKPNRLKIESKINQCKDSINDMLEEYDNNIQNYINKIVTCKKEHRLSEVDNYKNKLKMTLYRRERMSKLLDQVDSFQMMINEAFAKNEVYSALGTIMNEAGKIQMNPEIKKTLKQMNDFEKSFTKNCNTFDSVFKNIGSSVDSIDKQVANDYDSEIDNIVNDRMKIYDETVLKVVDDIESIDNQIDSL